MKTEKLSIIYEPKPYIDDAKLLTSLCIYYDEINLFGNKKIGDLYSEVLNDEDNKMLRFLQGPYKLLNKEGILNLYTDDEVTNVFPKISDLELSIDGFEIVNNSLLLKLNPDGCNNLTKKILETVFNKDACNSVKISDLSRSVSVFSVAESYNIPIITNKNLNTSNNTPERYIKTVSEQLAIMTISKLALPELSCVDYEDILLVRTNLKDELLEFRTGILDLTYFLCKNIDNHHSMADINYECTLLIETKIKASVLNLENAIRKHKNSKVRNLIFSAAKLLLTGSNLFMASSSLRDITSDITGLLDVSKDSTDISIPEHRIASFVYKTSKVLN